MLSNPPAQQYNFHFPVGTAWETALSFFLDSASTIPLEIRTRTYKGVIRRNYNDPPLEEMTVTFGTEVDGVINTVYFSVAKEQTALIPPNCLLQDVPDIDTLRSLSLDQLPSDYYVYDIFETIASKTDLLLWGGVLVSYSASGID